MSRLLDPDGILEGQEGLYGVREGHAGGTERENRSLENVPGPDLCGTDLYGVREGQAGCTA